MFNVLVSSSNNNSSYLLLIFNKINTIISHIAIQLQNVWPYCEGQQTSIATLDLFFFLNHILKIAHTHKKKIIF